MKRGIAFAVTLGIIIIGAMILFKSSTVFAQESTVCAVHSSQGTCQDVSPSQVTSGSATYQTSCSTGPGECAVGTCVTSDGVCLPSPHASCDTSLGGTWYSTSPSNTAVCNTGCCVIEKQGGSITTRANCNSQAALNPGAKTEFRTDITNDLVCSAMAFASDQGACVISTNTGETCKFTTQGDCLNITNDANEFHKNWLCTNQNLQNEGVNCTKTRDTQCSVDGKVYFKDSCGNLANVYDYSRISDTDYWNFVAGSQSGGTPTIESIATPGSATNGNCDYSSGSKCAAYDSNIDTGGAPRSGDYICRNLNCNSGPFVSEFNSAYNRNPVNGETWCARTDLGDPSKIAFGSNTGLTSGSGGNATLISSINKNDSLPGSRDFVLGCYDGQVTVEACSDYRNKICQQNLNNNSVYQASCVLNNYRSCYTQDSSSACSAAGDCQWIVGVSILKDNNGYPLVYDSSTGDLVKMTDEKGGSGTLGIFKNAPDGVDDLGRPGAACVPKYTPGFNTAATATQSESTSNVAVCNIGSLTCLVNYTRGAIAGLTGGKVHAAGGNEGWYVSGVVSCLDDNGKIVKGWEDNYTNMCLAIGDCGIGADYVGTNGANSQSSMFKVFGNLSDINSSASSTGAQGAAATIASSS